MQASAAEPWTSIVMLLNRTALQLLWGSVSGSITLHTRPTPSFSLTELPLQTMQLIHLRVLSRSSSWLLQAATNATTGGAPSAHDREREAMPEDVDTGI